MTIPQYDIRAFWKTGGVALGGWLNLPNAFIAEIMAHAGWDVLTLDLQHGLMDYDAALSVLHGIAGTGVVPFARLPWNEPGLIMKMLDAGCVGLIAPMISTREDAERFVAACRYSPQGYRSVGPARASLIYGADYVKRANEFVTTIALIETAEAIQRIDEIVTTPGLDGVLIGPTDLTRSLTGQPQLDFTNPTVASAIDRVAAAARRAGVVFGVYTLDEADTRTFASKGAQYLPFSADSRLLERIANDTVTRLRQGIAPEAETKSSMVGSTGTERIT